MPSTFVYRGARTDKAGFGYCPDSCTYARALGALLQNIDLSGDLSRLTQSAEQELQGLTATVNRIQSPVIDKNQVRQILQDLNNEIRQMQSAALKKGIGFLATVAKVAIPFL